MIPRLENHFEKIPARSLIYFLNYACFDIQPSPNNYETPSKFQFNFKNVLIPLCEFSEAYLLDATNVLNIMYLAK